jgi:hypothetical protein
MASGARSSSRASIPSRRVRENTTSSTSTTRIREKSPTRSVSPNDPSDIEEEPEPKKKARRGIDPEECTFQYIIITSINGVAVSTKTRTIKLIDLCGNHIVDTRMCENLAKKKAEEGGYEIEKGVFMLALYGSGTNKAENDLEDIHDWREMNRTLEDYLTKGVKRVRFELKANFSKKKSQDDDVMEVGGSTGKGRKNDKDKESPMAKRRKVSLLLSPY